MKLRTDYYKQVEELNSKYDANSFGHQCEDLWSDDTFPDTIYQDGVLVYTELFSRIMENEHLDYVAEAEKLVLFDIESYNGGNGWPDESCRDENDHLPMRLENTIYIAEKIALYLKWVNQKLNK